STDGAAGLRRASPTVTPTSPTPTTPATTYFFLLLVRSRIMSMATQQQVTGDRRGQEPPALLAGVTRKKRAPLQATQPLGSKSVGKSSTTQEQSGLFGNGIARPRSGRRVSVMGSGC